MGNMDKEDTKAFIRSLLTSRKKSYDLSEFLKDFHQENGYRLPLFGYSTPVDFLRSIPDVVQLEFSKYGIKLQPVESYKSKHIASLVKRQNCLKNGNEFRRELSWSEGFLPENDVRSEHDFSRNVSKSKDSQYSDLQLKTDEVNNWSILKGRKIPSHSSNGNCTDRFMDQKDEITNEVKVVKQVLESEILINLDEIPKLDLNSYAKTGDYVEVCVPEVYDPHKFSLQLRRFKVKLVNLMIQLQSFYNEAEAKYVIPNIELEANQLCAALCSTNSESSEWYRAVVLNYLDEQHVVVMLIDYGTVTNLPSSKLRYLHCCFGRLPAQAFPGKLANIQPCIGKKWPEESTKRFLSLVFERDLVAGIVDLNSKELWMSVALSYREKADVHVGDTLVDENLAIFKADDFGELSSGCRLRHTNWYKFTLLDMNKWCRPEKIGKVRKLRSIKEDIQSKAVEFLSYSESSDRLREMFS